MILNKTKTQTDASYLAAQSENYRAKFDSVGNIIELDTKGSSTLETWGKSKGLKEKKA